jgi:hypothetical protein
VRRAPITDREEPPLGVVELMLTLGPRNLRVTLTSARSHRIASR